MKFYAPVMNYLLVSLAFVTLLIFIPIDFLISQGAIDSLEAGAEAAVASGGTVPGFIESLIATYAAKFFLTEAVFSATIVAVTAWIIKSVPFAASTKLTRTLTPLVVSLTMGVAGFFVAKIASAGVFVGLTLWGALLFSLRVGMGSQSIFDILSGVFNNKPKT